ncbi:hypothetical protein Leryth_022101 [Lithospermum erythrorhizon]|nr:hypothetical protein Leryth_022101 [Lithospermum erythrorhizon]
MVGPSTNNAAEVFQSTVAKDGSGNYMKISDAVAAAPNYSKTRYTIKIKAGVYVEQVIVGKEKQNLAFIGDGADNTIISGDRSVNSGFTLQDTSTVDINGDYFIAMHITFNNSAGPLANQAVALRNNADYSAFYMCNFNGYQDTIYVDQGTQFFKNCNIYGSTDFIFGISAVVFQDCNIYVRNKINSEQVITAQGKEKTTEGLSGISFHRCHIQGAPDLDLKSGEKSFLGRPWRDSSTVVFMESTLESIIAPEGWELWEGVPPSPSIFYGEYNNKGAGASTNGRVEWAKPGESMTRLQAEQFTVRNLIKGSTWLPATKIPFDLDLAKP